MIYLCLGLLFISIFFIARYVLLQRAIQSAIRQMEEIKQRPERNRQLKALSTDQNLECLLQKINEIYQARQQERITYQRRETQIRREIENISHDLRTPLTSILGYVDLIQDEEEAFEEKETYLLLIQKRARVLQSFIHDFYELSRIEADDYPLLLDTVQVQNSLSEVAVAYYHEFEKKKIQVEFDLYEKASYIIADKIQLNRVLNNLIQNALKYAKSSFRIIQFLQDGECIIQFINDKNDMLEDELTLIFERFYTGDSSRSSQSTGLGLTIAKLLVEKMKGRISARYEHNLFVIELIFPTKQF